jgi:hypothetical protein
MKAIGGVMLVLLSLASTIASAQVARVEPVTGEVLVNAGAGYHPVAGVVDLKPGDSVIAKPSAQASLIYGDGCAVDVVPGMVAWVAFTSPCADKPDRIRDPTPTLSAPRAFDPAWLVDGAARIRPNKNPAGP